MATSKEERSINEALLDHIINHVIDLSHYSNDVVRRMLAVLDRADADLILRLQRALERLPMANFTISRLEHAMADIRALNKVAVNRLEYDLSNELRAFAEIEADFQFELLRGSLPEVAREALRAIDPSQAYTAAMARPFQGRLLKEWASGIESGKLMRVRDAVRMGYVENQTIGEIMQRLRGTKAANFQDAILSIDRRNAEAVVRTSIQHMAASTRERFYVANKEYISAKVWVSTLDSRTTHQCFPASVTAFAIGDSFGMTARFYEGDLVVITTAAGQQLHATPNHPVLTARGWRAMQEINPGSDILYRVDGDVGCVCGGVNVGMPPTIGAIADALFQPSIVDVSCERASKADFHGDGMAGDQQVQIARFDGNLRAALKASGREQIADALFVGVEFAAEFAGDGRRHQHILGRSPAIKPTQLEAGSLEHGKQPAAADVEALHDLRWAHTIAERGKNAITVASSVATPGDVRHDAGPLEGSRQRRGGDFVVPCNRCGRLSLRVSANDVVSVRRERFSGHVFNLETSSESYIAGGFIVHNCQIRDGKLYTIDNKPIDHKVPWLSGPGQLHWNCRSTSAPIIKGWDELGLKLPIGQRASMNGAVPADVTYKQWLVRQPASRQDQILGPVRGALLREGKLEIDRFWTDRGAFLTLNELRSRNAAAFRAAGL